ncbi:MAG: hypothetical protein KF691_01730 [Phycisphaeraceae bacterium]|nr:hypothetical protein [Phycisphaeraceae bacterium]
MLHPRSIPTAMAAALTLLASRASANDLVDLAKEILNQVIHAPVPATIAPVVTLAENSDTVAISGLIIWCALRERELLAENIDASPSRKREIKRQLKAIQQIKGKAAAVQTTILAKEKKAREKGWDPFYARFAPIGPLMIPGPNTFSLVIDGSEDEPGDAPPGPMASLVTPFFSGETSPFVPVLTSSAQADFLPAIPPFMTVQLNSFSLTLDSFDLMPGMPTGQNSGSLDPFGTPPVGLFDAATGLLSIRFEGVYVNNIHSGPAPIVFFASALGSLAGSPPEAIVVAGDPMIVPEPPGMTTRENPVLYGGSLLSYDAPGDSILMLENTTAAGSPDIAMARDAEGRFTHLPGEDPANGAVFTIGPIVRSGSVGPLLTFADTGFSLVKDSIVLLQGTIRDITLDPQTLVFDGSLETSSAPLLFGGSRVCNQIIAAAGAKRVVLVNGGTVTDLKEISAGFSQTALMPWPDVFQIEAVEGIDCPADLNGDGLVEDTDFVIFVASYNALVVPPASRFADLDEDGLVNDDDFVLFVAAYDALLCDQ